MLSIGVLVAAGAEATAPRKLLETRAIRVIVDEGGAWCGQAAAHVHFLADERSVYAATAAVSKGWRVECDDLSIRAGSALPLPRFEELPAAESVTPSDDRLAAPEVAASPSSPRHAGGGGAERASHPRGRPWRRSRCGSEPATTTRAGNSISSSPTRRSRSSTDSRGRARSSRPGSRSYQISGPACQSPSPTSRRQAERPPRRSKIRFRDVAGRVQGPYRLPFDPEHTIRSDAKRILDQMWTAWIASNESECSKGTTSKLRSFRP